jgi:hypothetical protein
LQEDKFQTIPERTTSVILFLNTLNMKETFMPDLFAGYTSGLESPPARAFAVTPHDDNDLTHATRAIMVAAAGNVALITVAGDSITLPALQPGVQYVIRAARILDTDTTATGIIALA